MKILKNIMSKSKFGTASQITISALLSTTLFTNAPHDIWLFEPYLIKIAD